jgi:PAS domain S-box-containing protein
MGLAGRCISWMISPDGGARSGTLRVTALGSVLVALFWIAGAATDTVLSGRRTFFQYLAEPNPHGMVDLALVLAASAVFLHFTIRAARLRAALELALQEALLKAESERSKLVAIVEAMGDAISIQDPELTVLYQNRAHQELMGIHVGKRCYDAYRHKSEVCPRCHLVEAFHDGGVHRAEMNLQRGEVARCLEIIASALKDSAGRVIAGIEVCRDITDRKVAEQAAKKEAALLQHLIDTISNPIYYQDLAGRFLWCNTAFALWLAKSREELIGRTIFEVAPEKLCRRFQCQEPGEDQVATAECSLRWEDGELRDVIFNKSLFRDEAGERSGVVGVIIDITLRKRAEDEVVGLNKALTRQALELNQANRELEAFCHAISHDLRTPLTKIYSSGQALQEYGAVLDENGKFFVKSINDGSLQVEAMLDALLDLSRVGEVELVPRPVDLSRLAQEKAAELRQSDPGRSVSFLIAPKLMVQGDSQLLLIALGNLLGNAWKYTSGVAEPVIEFGSFTSEDGETVFFLKDNGAGFDNACAGQLFKPFHRLHSSREFPGTGLGLTTVLRIIRRHNGRIWGEGRPGSGATFYFTVNG